MQPPVQRETFIKIVYKPMAVSLILGFFTVLVFSEISYSKGKGLQETMAVTVVVSGDMIGSFDFGGPVGATLEADPTEPGLKGPVCKAEFLFRKVVLAAADLQAAPGVTKADQLAVEVWPTFKCLIQGQTKTYKIHRQYLKMTDEVQKKEIHNIDQNLKNITLEFRDLAVQKGK